MGWRTLAMRRAVWADGVESLSQAMEYVNGLIAAEARSLAAITNGELRVLDIGCGVGGSLLFLAGAVDARLMGIGITISPRQAVIARRQARIRGLSSTCSFIAADFAGVTGLARFHFAFAIESYVHFPAPDSFFAPAAASIAPGGRLVVVDDFLSRESRSRTERGFVDAFRRGWLLPSLCTVDGAVRSAAVRGMRLVEDRDLSAFLSGHPLSARLGEWLGRVLGSLPIPGHYWRSTMGSLALASCQEAGLVGYHCLVFEKGKA
jgi:cyclopropane fatty-acyl-phospholipid synthase-like methyltransferase